MTRSRPSSRWSGHWESRRSCVRGGSRWRDRFSSTAIAVEIRRTIRMKIYYDRDADLSVLKPKKIAVLGFGSQGHAHALNLRDTGMDVRVGLRKGSPSWEKAAGQGLPVLETADAAKQADIIMILVPDEMGS